MAALRDLIPLATGSSAPGRSLFCPRLFARWPYFVLTWREIEIKGTRPSFGSAATISRLVSCLLYSRYCLSFCFIQWWIYFISIFWGASNRGVVLHFRRKLSWSASLSAGGRWSDRTIHHLEVWLASCVRLSGNSSNSSRALVASQSDMQIWASRSIRGLSICLCASPMWFENPFVVSRYRRLFGLEDFFFVYSFWTIRFGPSVAPSVTRRWSVVARRPFPTPPLSTRSQNHGQPFQLRTAFIVDHRCILDRGDIDLPEKRTG